MDDDELERWIAKWVSRLRRTASARLELDAITRSILEMKAAGKSWKVIARVVRMAPGGVKARFYAYLWRRMLRDDNEKSESS